MSFITIDHGTPQKHELEAIAEALGEPDELWSRLTASQRVKFVRRAVLGIFVDLWIWEDADGRDCAIRGAKKEDFDRRCAVPGLFEAAKNQRWISAQKGRLVFPRIDRHNEEHAKRKALARRRKARERSRLGPEDVTSKTLGPDGRTDNQTDGRTDGQGDADPPAEPLALGRVESDRRMKQAAVDTYAKRVGFDNPTTRQLETLNRLMVAGIDDQCIRRLRKNTIPMVEIDEALAAVRGAKKPSAALQAKLGLAKARRKGAT